MKTTAQLDLKTKPLLRSVSYTFLRKKETGLFNFKFYQKIFVAFISLSIFLILPESPTELEKICEGYNPISLCDVW